MKNSFLILVCLGGAAVIAGAAAGGFWAGRHTQPAPSAAPAEVADEPAATAPVASVQVMTLAPADIIQTFDAYGTVVSDPSTQQTVTAPYEGRVLSILVRPGELVQAGRAVAEIEPSLDVKLAALQAKSAVDAAQREMANTQERFNMKLATNQELQTSQNQLRDATLKFDDLKLRGATGNLTLKAKAAGTVVKADVNAGQIIASGGAVLEIDDPRASLVKLGVEAQDAQRLAFGAAVDLTQVGFAGARPVRGQVRLIPLRINPDTRLVDVLVSLPAEAHWLMGSFAEGRLVIGEKRNALVVPRAAVLPTDEGQKLFTLADGKAVSHTVTIGLETDRQYEIAEATPPLNLGDLVVIAGNYELDDGMATATRPAP